jgi:gas vesicle protein
MKSTILRTMIAMAMVLWSLSITGVVKADTAAEETRLKTIQESIDKNAQEKPDQSQVQALAEQFEVSESEIERLRNNGQGWGEIKIELTMARHLAETDSTTYPSFSDALKRIEDERALGKGWGKISDDLGFKLGPVISEAQQEGKELRMEMKEDAQESQEAARDLQKESKDLMKEAQKESKQNAKESREAVNDTLKEAKEIKADPKGK